MKKDNLWKKKGISFIASQAITLFGSSIVQMAIVWYVTMQTSSGIWLTILTLPRPKHRNQQPQQTYHRALKDTY